MCGCPQGLSAQLIENGVELYEYRPDSPVSKTRAYRGESKSALHTKAIVFDRESVFIGSFNLDPRSGSINTETGIYVESPELAEGVQPGNSYRVQPTHTACIKTRY
jgi:putative cardiolipin synthase